MWLKQLFDAKLLILRYHLSEFQKLRQSDTYNQVISCTRHGRPAQSVFPTHLVQIEIMKTEAKVWAVKYSLHAKPNRGYPCSGLAAIFARMLYSVQIIQKSSTRNIMHVNIIYSFKIARQVTRGHWLNALNGEYYGNDLFCLQSRIQWSGSTLLYLRLLPYYNRCK